MKKIILIFVFFFIITNKSFASCSNNIEFNWNITGDQANFEFLNNGNKSIIINYLQIKTEKSEVIKKKRPIHEKTVKSYTSGYPAKIPKFGRKNLYMYIGDIQKRFIKYGSYTCSDVKQIKIDNMKYILLGAAIAFAMYLGDKYIL